MLINEKELTIPDIGLTSKQVAALFELPLITVQKYAARYNVTHIGEGRHKTYYFSEPELTRFMNRPKPGRRRHTE